MKRLLLVCLFLFSAAALTARTRSGENYRDTGRTQEELRKEAGDLETAALQNPGDIELHIRLGFIYTKLERADDAQRAFENAVRLDPKRAIAHYMLGLIYEKKGMTERAITAWRACLDNAGEERLRETARKHLHHLKGS